MPTSQKNKIKTKITEKAKNVKMPKKPKQSKNPDKP